MPPPDYSLFTLEQLILKFQEEPLLIPIWEAAGEYDIRFKEQVWDKVTGKKITQYQAPWDAKTKEDMLTDKNKILYLIEQAHPELKEISQWHQAPSFSEKWKYGALDPMEEAFTGSGFKDIWAATTRLWYEDEKSKNEYDGRMTDMLTRLVKHKDESASPDDKDKAQMDWNFFATELSKFIQPTAPTSYFDRKIGQWITKGLGLDKYVDAERRQEALKKINDRAEDMAIAELKKWNERREKDPRYYAYQHYMQNKPVGWFTTFDLEDSGGSYFVDTVIGLVPSIAVTAVAAAGAIGVGAITTRAGRPDIAVKLASIAGSAINVGGFMPLEAVGSYSEAYNWTMERYEDEELARNNAAVATAQYLAIVGITEGWGGSRLAKMVMPEAWLRASKRGLASRLFKKNLADADRVHNMKKLQALAKGGSKAEWYRFTEFLKSPVREASQEFIQLMGDYGTQLGYKDETLDDIWSPTELHESVIGGGLMVSVWVY